MARDDILVAKSAFVVGHRVVRKGETFRKGHPLIEGREQLFKPFTVDHEHKQATKAPGEKRQKPPKETPADPGHPLEPNPVGSI